MSSSPWRHLLLTGEPGVGKTTVVTKLAELLPASGAQVMGFITQERRGSSRTSGRIGFDLTPLDPSTGKVAIDEAVMLARLSSNSTVAGGRPLPTVGRYDVYVDNVDTTAVAILNEMHKQSAGTSASGTAPKVVGIVDEIGKMECFSKAFCMSMEELLLKQELVPIVATIALKGGGFVAKAKEFPSVEVIEVTRENRDSLPDALATKVAAMLASHQ